MYLIACDAANAVKVGYARKPDDRRGDLQVGNPFELTVLAVTLTSRPQRDESLLKRYFAKHWIRGEWFHREPVLAEILPVFLEHRLYEFTCKLEGPVTIGGRKQMRLPMSLSRRDWKAKFSALRRKTAAEKRARQKPGL